MGEREDKEKGQSVTTIRLMDKEEDRQRRRREEEREERQGSLQCHLPSLLLFSR